MTYATLRKKRKKLQKLVEECKRGIASAPSNGLVDLIEAQKALDKSQAVLDRAKNLKRRIKRGI